MSIIGNAIAGGIGDGMRTYAGQLASNQQAEERRMAIAMELKAKRDALLEELAAKKSEGDAERAARIDAEKVRGEALVKAEAEKRKSKFEERPDLYGANATPIDRAKYESEQTTRTDDSEYGDAVSRRMAPYVKTKTFDEEGYGKAEDARVQKNIDRKTQVDTPQYADDQQRGAGRGIVNDLLRKDPQSADAAAAAMAVEGKTRFSQSTGGNTVLDNATGKVAVTDVGASVVKKNERPPAAKSGGGASSNNVFKVESIGGRSVAIKRDGTKVDLGPSDKFAAKVADTVIKMAKDSYQFRSLPPEEQKQRAAALLANGATSQGDNGAAPARPPLSSFMRK